MDATRLGLRIDVDTLRGTREGIPGLLYALMGAGVRATFFVCLGPDNMGRHSWRLLRPRFAAKMLRSRASTLYGWSILTAGTFWPGRKIGAALQPTLRAVEAAGHEVGLHAWDHHGWQVGALRWPQATLESKIARGVQAFGEVFGRRPDCSAAAGWICNEHVLAAKQAFGFRYNSDCRGHSVFTPRVAGKSCAPQVPTTLPTYDESIGRNGVTDRNYNEWLLARIERGPLNILTVHAEVEGIARLRMFARFLRACAERGIELCTLAELLPHGAPPEDTIAQGPIRGRAGDVCWQRSALAKQCP